jgi:spore coat polysaccharide biosynthesis protein SpsF
MPLSCHIYVQARMGSTRLPGKVLHPVLGKPLLSYLLERLKRVQNAQKIVVATTSNAEDDAIETLCKKEGVYSFRGNEENVLHRFWSCAEQDKPEAIVRITGDCPLIDPAIIDKIIEEYTSNKDWVDYVSNTLTRSYPRGMDCEIFSYKALQKAYEAETTASEKEHVTLYMYLHPELFKLKDIEYKQDLSHLRLTVDTKEDFELIRLILENLYPKHPMFSLQDIIDVLDQHPSWKKINSSIEQKPTL